MKKKKNRLDFKPYSTIYAAETSCGHWLLAFQWANMIYTVDEDQLLEWINTMRRPPYVATEEDLKAARNNAVLDELRGEEP